MLGTLALGSTTLLSSSALAQDSEPGNTGSIHVDIALDWTSAYYFRGLLQEDKGTILQPSIEVGIDLMESDSMSLSATVGSWGSFHSKETGSSSADSFVADWYENDIYAGLGLNRGDWDFSLVFTNNASPNRAYDSNDELTIGVGLDDSSLWDFPLNPSLALSTETHDRGGDENSYLELGLSHSFEWELSGDKSIAIDVPLTVGMSIDDYYVDASGDEDTIGFFDIGVDASYDLSCSSEYGTCSLGAGLHFLSLGDAAEAANGDEDSEVVFSFGLSLSY